MTKTGDWTITDLIKYLAVIRNSLSQVTIDRLRQTSAFLQELTTDAPNYEQEKAKRYKASEVYEPLDSLRGLRLPIIDWGTHARWRASTREGNARGSLFSTFPYCSHSQIPIPSWVMPIPTSPCHSEASGIYWRSSELQRYFNITSVLMKLKDGRKIIEKSQGRKKDNREMTRTF